jgi:hypothetical protein
MGAATIRPRYALILLTLLAGCAARNEAVSVDEVQHRLAAVERERLAMHASSGLRSLADERPMASDDPERAGVFALSDLSTDAAPAEAAADEQRAAERADRWVYPPLLPTFKENAKRDLKTMAPDLWRDTKRVYANPVNLAILGASYGGALAVQQTGPDKTVENHYDKDHTFSKGWRDAFGALGNPGTHFAVAGAMYLVGEQIQDEKTYQVSKALFSALIINGISTMVGQTATWDRSPNGEWGTFPSGHTSSSFCFATVMNEAYGPLVGIPLYGLGTLVAIERLDDREHYMSDVLFGAVLGTVVGHSVATGRDPEFFGWKVLPYVDPAQGVSGVAFMKQYK